jgi:hypothetical protein
LSFTVAQIDAQTKTFEQAYRSGKITSAQYNLAMRTQSANRAAALKREQPKQQPSAPAQAPSAAGLPRSNYWTAMPSPAKPSVMPTSGADLSRAGGTQITPPEGYVVTNVQPTMVEMQGPIAPGKTKADMMVPAVSYELQEKPKPVQQSDLGIGAQLLVAADVFGKIVESKTKDNTVINQLVKAETKMALQPMLNFEAGAINALETEAYGTASLAKSVVSSVSQKQLVYTPVKTPQLGPTVVGGGISLVTGSGEAQRMNEMPFGYSQGSLFGEVGVSLLTGMATGAVAGKTSTVIKTVINPRVNRAAESALARSTRLFESASNRIEPGLGKATELVVSRKAAAIGTKLDLVGAKAGAALTGKLVSPVKYGVKYGVVEPVKAKISLVGEKVASSQLVSKAGGVAGRVVPDLKVYSKVVTGKYADDLVPQYMKDVRLASEPFRDAPKNLVKGIKETGMYQGASYAKSVQAPNTEMAKLLRAVPKSSLDDLTLKSALRAEQKLVSPAASKSVSKIAVTKPYISKELGQIGSLTTVKTKTSTPLSKMVSDIEKSASNAKTAISKASGARQITMQIGIDAKPQVLTKVKPISVKSTKNIGTFEALQMSKQVAKQGKRLTQLVPYAPKEISKVPTLAKPAAEIKQVTTQIQKASTKEAKQEFTISGMPKVASPYPGTQRQRIREDYELVSVSYPKEVSGLVPIVVPDLTPSPPSEGKSEFVPVIVPFVIPDVTPKPDIPSIPDMKPIPVPPSTIPKIIPVSDTDQWQPQPIIPIFKVDPDQIIDPRTEIITQPLLDDPKPRIPIPNFSSFSLGGGGGGRGGGDALTGKWFRYKNPIKTPKQMLKDFSTFGSTKRTTKQAVGNIGFNTKTFKSNPILNFNPVRGKKQKNPFGNFAVNNRNNLKVLKGLSTFGGGKGKRKQSFGDMGLRVPKTNLVSINANMFKQPRKRYNKVKQRRKSKR